MAKSSANDAQAKRRWYHNVKDAYGVVSRSFKWLPWAMWGSTLVLVGASIALAVFTDSTISWSIIAVLMAFTVPMLWLTLLLKKALMRQIEHMKGAVGASIRDLRRNWIAGEEPVAVNKEQDLVWRVVGRPGVVLIGEGHSSRVQKMLKDEEKKVKRLSANVSVHRIECGLQEGQVRLENLTKTMYKLPNTISKADVPVVAKLLSSLQAKTGLPIPKGIDPMKARPDRKAMRGR